MRRSVSRYNGEVAEDGVAVGPGSTAFAEGGGVSRKLVLNSSVYSVGIVYAGGLGACVRWSVGSSRMGVGVWGVVQP